MGFLSVLLLFSIYIFDKHQRHCFVSIVRCTDNLSSGVYTKSHTLLLTYVVFGRQQQKFTFSFTGIQNTILFLSNSHAE